MKKYKIMATVLAIMCICAACGTKANEEATETGVSDTEVTESVSEVTDTPVEETTESVSETNGVLDAETTTGVISETVGTFIDVVPKSESDSDYSDLEWKYSPMNYAFNYCNGVIEDSYRPVSLMTSDEYVADFGQESDSEILASIFPASEENTVNYSFIDKDAEQEFNFVNVAIKYADDYSDGFKAAALVDVISVNAEAQDFSSTKKLVVDKDSVKHFELPMTGYVTAENWCEANGESIEDVGYGDYFNLETGKYEMIEMHQNVPAISYFDGSFSDEGSISIRFTAYGSIDVSISGDVRQTKSGSGISNFEMNKVVSNYMPNFEYRSTEEWQELSMEKLAEANIALGSEVYSDYRDGGIAMLSERNVEALNNLLALDVDDEVWQYVPNWEKELYYNIKVHGLK